MIQELLATQRDIRARRDAAIRRGIVAVIDIGSSKISMMIIRFTPFSEDEGASVKLSGRTKAFRVLVSAQVQSRGVDAGEIVSMSAVEQSLMHLAAQVQKRAGVRVDHAIVCYSGGNPLSDGTSGESKVRDNEVCEADIGAAVVTCELPDCGNLREIIHAMPVNFALDQRSELLDPRGQIGSSLSVDMHVVSTDSRPLHSLNSVMKRVGIELIGVSVSAYAAGLAVLTEDEQQLGAAVIDLGGSTTSMAMFLRKQLICTESVSIGGKHITSDIAYGLRLDAREAERLKAMHGGTEVTAIDDRELIDIVAQGQEFAETRQVTRSELISIIRPRVEEILESAREMLSRSGFDYLPSQRIVLTGGGSQLPGIETLAENILGRQVRIGRPLRLVGLPSEHAGAGFAGMIGLAMYTSMPRDEMWDFETPLDKAAPKKMKAMLSWFVDNW